MTQVDTAEKILVFDRTPVARLISCAAAFGSAGLFFDALAGYLNRTDSIYPVIGFFLLFLGTLFSALMQYGDHIYLAPQGVLYENKWLPFLTRSGRWLNWEDVIEIREIKRKILILLAEDGRRILVDAIAGYPIARREILRRAPHAVISGTLRKEDRL